MRAARLKHFGWGREGEGLTAEEEAFVIARAEARFGTALNESASAPRLEDIKLEAPRVTAPASLPFCTSCADHGGTPEASGAEAHREGAAGVWRTAFIRMPYAKERLILRGMINDTFETSITWERF